MILVLLNIITLNTSNKREQLLCVVCVYINKHDYLLLIILTLFHSLNPNKEQGCGSDVSNNNIILIIVTYHIMVFCYFDLCGYL